MSCEDQDLYNVLFSESWELNNLYTQFIGVIPVPRKEYEITCSSNHNTNIYIDKDNPDEMKLRFSLWSIMSFEILFMKSKPETSILTGTHVPPDVFLQKYELNDFHEFRFKSKQNRLDILIRIR